MITDKGISNNNHKYMGLSNLNILQLILLNEQISSVTAEQKIYGNRLKTVQRSINSKQKSNKANQAKGI